jgi:hypothetical protein
MEFVQHPANIDAWTPATDEGTQPPVPIAPDPDTVPTPVVNLIQVKEKSGTAYLRVVIVDPNDDSLTPVVQYRVTDNGSGNPGAWLEQKFPDATPSGGFIELATKPVPVDQPLQVQVAFEPSDEEYGPWSPTVDIVAGKQLIVNGGFWSSSSWSLGTGWTIGSGVASYTSGSGFLTQDIPLEAGASYLVTYTITALASGLVRARLRGDTDGLGVTRSAVGTYSETIVAPAGASAFAFTASGAASVDNVTVRRTA